MPRTWSRSARHDAVPREAVLTALAEWAERARRAEPSIVRIACFGSYARGNYLPSSDADVFIEVSSTSATRPHDRADALPGTEGPPVGTELFVYTSEEIEAARGRGSRWLAEVEREAVWL